KQGILPTLKITTFSGREIITALDHPFLTATGWKEAKDLLIEDILGCPVPIHDFGEHIDDEEARLLGYFIGDGSISGNNANITSHDEIAINDIKHCVKHLGFKCEEKAYNIKNKLPHHSKTLKRINIKKGVRDWLKI